MSGNLFQFPDRAAGVVASRLADARVALQLSRSDVAREIGVTGTAVGHYENGDRRPDMATLLKLSRVLRQPVSFFFKEAAPLRRKKVRFFRSVGPKSNKANMALDIRTDWVWEFTQRLMQAGIRFPTPNIPLFENVGRGEFYTPDDIEYIAAQARRHWKLGDGPINNMVALLESQGVILCRFEMLSQKIDAFSCWIDGRPFVLLSSDKGASVRSRFDAAHELGHLIMHRDVSSDDMESKAVRERLEKEANWFAGAFLLPRNLLYREFYSTRSSHLKGLKQRWLVSMQAIAHRAKDIGAIDESQYVAFRIQMTKRKELSNEPLDDVIPVECPGLIFNAWKKLVERGLLPPFDSEETMEISAEVLRDHFGRDVMATKSASAPLTLIR